MSKSIITLPSFLTTPNPNIYLSDNYVVLDFETTNLDKGSALNPDNRLVLSTWVVGDTHRQRNDAVRPDNRVQYKSERSLPRALKRDIESADFIVAQNAKFELQWLQREGVDISQILVYDTLIGEYVRLGNRRGEKHLDALAARYGVGAKPSLTKSLIKGGVCPSDIPERWLIEYGCHDTYITEQVFLRQRGELSGMGLLPVLFTRCLVTPVLADIEKTGVYLDKERVYKEYDTSRDKQEKAERKLFQDYAGVNFNSSKQLGELLYDKLGFTELVRFDGTPSRTAGGSRRTDAECINSLQSRTEVQQAFKETIKELRKATKELEYLTKLKECCDVADGRLLANYNQTITQNHRLSSTGKTFKVQLHNVPRKYKGLYRARHSGWNVGEGDGKQLEFRAAAHLGRDKVALSDIRDKVDVHRNTASVYNHKRPEAVTADERQDAKPQTFEPLYGKLHGDALTEKYIKFFQSRYKGIFDTQTNWTYQVLKDKELTTEWGLKFYWPDVRMSKSGYIKYTTNIFNYPVSSFATAEIIPVALVYCWHMFKALGLDSFIVNTVHDSVIAEVPKYETDVVMGIYRDCFTHRCISYLSTVYNVSLVVPLGVESKFGEHWGDGDAGKDDYEVDPLEKTAA